MRKFTQGSLGVAFNSLGLSCGRTVSRLPSRSNIKTKDFHGRQAFHISLVYGLCGARDVYNII